jgi:hypothetical protein
MRTPADVLPHHTCGLYLNFEATMSSFSSLSKHKRQFRVHTAHETSPGRSDIIISSLSRSHSFPSAQHAHQRPLSPSVARPHPPPLHEFNQSLSSPQIHHHHIKKSSCLSPGSSYDHWKKVWNVPTAHETSIGKTDIPLPPPLPPPKSKTKEIPNSHIKKGLLSEQESIREWKKWQGQWQKWSEIEKQTKGRKKDNHYKLKKKMTTLSPRSSFQQEQSSDQQSSGHASDLENRYNENDKQSENSSLDLNLIPRSSQSSLPSTHLSTTHEHHHLSLDESRSAATTAAIATAASSSSLWEIIHTSLLRLIDLGYDRSLLFSILPSVEKRIFHFSSFKYLSQRFMKRVSMSWQNDEPLEVVQLCQHVLNAYQKLLSLSHDHDSISFIEREERSH